MPPPFTSFEATGFPSEILREVLTFAFVLLSSIFIQHWWSVAAVSNPS